MAERVTTLGAGRYATLVLGPRAAEPGASAFVLPAGLRERLYQLFHEQFRNPPTNPLQMMVEAKEFNPVLVHFQTTGPAAAVAHFLIGNPSGRRPALAGICLLLGGRDAGADEQAVAALERSRDSSGRALPLRPAVVKALRDARRPLCGLVFFTEQTLKDPSLRILAGCLADAFFDVAGVPGGPSRA